MDGRTKIEKIPHQQQKFMTDMEVTINNKFSKIYNEQADLASCSKIETSRALTW